MGEAEYFVVLAACVLVTLPLELVLGVRVYRQPRRLVATVTCTAVLFVAWDLAGAALGHWDYNAAYVTGLGLAGLPVEEYTFFVVVPLATVMAYEATRLSLPATTRWLGRQRARVSRRRGDTTYGRGTDPSGRHPADPTGRHRADPTAGHRAGPDDRAEPR